MPYTVNGNELDTDDQGYLLEADYSDEVVHVIAAAEGIDLGQASKMSRLAQLAPDLIEAIALGRLDVGVSQLLRGRLSASWLAQREALVAGWR